jgi:hypothetical protein
MQVGKVSPTDISRQSVSAKYKYTKYQMQVDMFLQQMQVDMFLRQMQVDKVSLTDASRKSASDRCKWAKCI